MIAPDSSVAIAADVPWHEAHAAAVAALSRMPQGQRVAPAIMLAWLERRFRARWLVLPAAVARRALRAGVDGGIRGGALYDVLIAATAAHHHHHHHHVLISVDRRAARAYELAGAEVSYLL